MNYHALRYLFELLCDRFEQECDQQQVSFQGAIGMELPQGVVMVLVSDRHVAVYQVSLKEVSSFAQVEQSQPLTADECIEMRQRICGKDMSFSKLFSLQS